MVNKPFSIFRLTFYWISISFNGIFLFLCTEYVEVVQTIFIDGILHQIEWNLIDLGRRMGHWKYPIEIKILLLAFNLWFTPTGNSGDESSLIHCCHILYRFTSNKTTICRSSRDHLTLNRNAITWSWDVDRMRRWSRAMVESWNGSDGMEISIIFGLQHHMPHTA